MKILNKPNGYDANGIKTQPKPKVNKPYRSLLRKILDANRKMWRDFEFGKWQRESKNE